jgi:hypothetical protein
MQPIRWLSVLPLLILLNADASAQVVRIELIVTGAEMH